jgi:hypothetical protein
MKKYILILLLITTMVPSVAFASWWNPFTWNLKNIFINIFNQNREQIQITGEEKEKLEKKGLEEDGYTEKGIDDYQGTFDSKQNNNQKNQLRVEEPEEGLLKHEEKNKVIVKPNTGVIELTTDSKKEDTMESQILPLDIKEVKIKVKDDVATITWETNYPTESTLTIINTVDKFYTSEKGLNDKHLVRIYELEKDQEYNFKIKATTENKSQTDTHFQSFFAIEEIQAHLGEYEEGKYQKITIIDSGGRLKNKKVGIGLYKKTGDVLYSYGRVYLETNSYGEIEFKDKKLVDKVNRFVISYLDYDDVIIDRE